MEPTLSSKNGENYESAHLRDRNTYIQRLLYLRKNYCPFIRQHLIIFDRRTHHVYNFTVKTDSFKVNKRNKVVKYAIFHWTDSSCGDCKSHYDKEWKGKGKHRRSDVTVLSVEGISE